MRFSSTVIVFSIASAAFAAPLASEDYLKRFKPALKGSVDASGVYRLSKEEQGYDCRQLTGHMQLRILDMRDYEKRDQPTFFSQGFQWLVKLLLGGGGASAGPAKQHALDRAMLEAFNRQLAAKKCPVFDLRAELVPKDVMDTPAPLARSKTP